eukprot:3943312-Alexandrium_andersonii.AAC.1
MLDKSATGPLTGQTNFFTCTTRSAASSPSSSKSGKSQKRTAVEGASPPALVPRPGHKPGKAASSSPRGGRVATRAMLSLFPALASVSAAPPGTKPGKPSAAGARPADMGTKHSSPA